jgi:hypothetical protein
MLKLAQVLQSHLGEIQRGQYFQSLPKSLPSHFRGLNEAWGQIPPPDWRAREVIKQLGSNGLGVCEVLGSDKPEPIL